MTYKLLPCPFCGGTPILELFNDGFFDYARIQCCHVMFDWCGDKTGEQAVSAWNRRTHPVKHGEWFLVSTTKHAYDIELEEKCSICGRYVYRYDTQPQDKYCPNCGAKMDKESENNA